MQPIFNRLGSFVRWRPRRHRPRECRQGDPIIKKGRKPSSTSIGCRQEKIPNNLKVRFYFRFFSFETPLGWGEPMARSLDWTNKTIFGRKKKKTFASVVLSLAGAHSLSTRAVIAPTAIQIEIISSKNFTLFFSKIDFPFLFVCQQGRTNHDRGVSSSSSALSSISSSHTKTQERGK